MAGGPAPGWAAAAALARSGVLALTGWSDGPPVWPPLGLPARLDAVVGEIAARTAARGRPVRVSWESALSGRASLLGFSRQGGTSANGTCRLLRSRDGWVALNLPRSDDFELLPALTGRPVIDPWADAATAAARGTADDFAAQARLLGLAAAPVPESIGVAAVAVAVSERWSSRAGGFPDRWRVVDLSSLWGGPLVARVLAEAGAAVTKIESTTRPDGARARPAFYRWVHGTAEATRQLDLRSDEGRRQAAELIDEADVVIEGSRPRALEQLGLGPHDRPGQAGRVWLSITGYGRDEPGRHWAAFGDDAAVAGGLVGWDRHHEPVFCGDAVADPISGLLGSVAVLRALDEGGGQLIDLAMSRVAAQVAAAGVGDQLGPVAIEADGAGGWSVRAGELVEPVRVGPAHLEWVRGG